MTTTEKDGLPAAGSAQGAHWLARWFAGVPEARIRSVGRLIGTLLYSVDVPHRRIVRRNLGFAYPDWSIDRIRSCSKRIFENLGMTLVEIVQLRYLSADQLARRIHIEGEDVIAEGMERPGGAVIISAHLGNWELAPLFFASNFGRSVEVVARDVRPPFLNRWVISRRTRFNNRVINKQRGLPRMTRSLREGNILGMLIDQGTKKSEGVAVEFFNRKATATPAAALLAMRCRCPVYPAFTVRRRQGGFRLIALPMLELQRSRDLRADLQANTQTMMGIIEKMIRDYPDQWFWVNKRWKHYFPELYPEYQARRQRRRKRKFKRMAASMSAAPGGRGSTPK